MFINYKDNKPVNFSLVEYFEKYSDSINFYSSHSMITWYFSSQEETDKVYKKILNGSSINLNEEE